jgi:hypothetical protein
MSNLNKLIRISEETEKKLATFGKFKDDYNSIINRVLEQNEKFMELGNPEIKNQ